MKNGILFLVICMLSCKATQKTVIPAWIPYDESVELAENALHKSSKMRYKLIQSRLLDKNEMWKNVSMQIRNFSEKDYQRLLPFILEQNIPTLQSHILSGRLTYTLLTQWYLYRIVKYENDKSTSLNNIISINPNAVNEARKRDRNKSVMQHPVYGMPIMLKDNINMQGLPTTAGAAALRNNKPTDAFIADRIKENGGIIIGKANLSEWANFLCADCPNGYSAIGGQTLNPYGRRIYDTGGSSSGSGSAMAANYAAAAVGTETSGSILSPASANSIVGLKPTTGLLSRTGIVPISGTLDTPGPMTRNVTDNAILLSAMCGRDSTDDANRDNSANIKYWENLKNASLKGIRFGIFKNYLTDSLYKQSIQKITSLGGILIEIVPEKITLDSFGILLSADMKTDLPNYLNKHTSDDVTLHTVAAIVEYNLQDTLLRIPYGQARFDGILKENMRTADLNQLKIKLNKAGVLFFEKHISTHQLDAILSINNRDAGFAAVAKYPCLTVPMGYLKSGEPAGLTFIARPFEEDKLLKIGFAFEQATRLRKIPIKYK